MVAKGDDLTRPRNINFSLLFSDEASAQKFAEHFRSLGYEVSVKGDYPNQEYPWDVTVVREIPHPTRGSLILKTYCNPLQTIGEGKMTAGAVSPDRLERVLSRVEGRSDRLTLPNRKTCLQLLRRPAKEENFGPAWKSATLLKRVT